jgi:hypothetical protein
MVANIATSAQQNYLDLLFTELGFDRQQRNAFMKRELNREVNYLDELTVTEASRFIRSLIERKEDRKPQFNQGLAKRANMGNYNRFYKSR